MKAAFWRLVRRLLRGPRVSRALGSLGIDARRYWLLIDLFGTISERREMFSQLGTDGLSLQFAAWLYAIFSALMSLLLIMVGKSVVVYFWAFLAFTAFLMLTILFSETSNSLVNPVEGLVLAHQPINGATYTAAKLTHLLRILLYLVPGLNIVPALAGLIFTDSRWFYPLVHMLAAFVVGLLVALLCCAVFGWLVRFVPPNRLKAIGQVAETLPWLGYLVLQFSRELRQHIHAPAWLLADTTLRRTLAVGFGVLSVAIVVLGLRCLSADYLVRVASIVHGGSGRKSKVRRSRLSDLVARFFGGPASRAGFEYTSRLMIRDWQFRRQMIPMIPVALVPAALLATGWRISPFSGKFTGMHVMPHIFGILLFLICTVLVYGSDHKAAWLFLLAPAGAYGRFAKGVYARLWFVFAIVPHVALILVLPWLWGIRDAGLFVAYSLAAVSFYLGLELRLVDGLPFSKQAEPTRSPVSQLLMFAGGIVIAIAVGVQFFLVFRSPVVVVAVTLALAASAYLVTRRGLETFEVAIRFNLGLLSMETKGIYTEVQ